MDGALFFSVLYASSLGLGVLLERIRVPWIFAALIVGLVLAWHNPFADVTGSTAFTLLGELGLHFFLVVIGLSMEIERLWQSRRLLLRVSLAIIGTELVLGSIFIHYVFGTPWHIAVVVALTFATVGEAFLLPILDELRLTDTGLGQTILGIGFVDNLFEVVAVVAITILIGLGGSEDVIDPVSALVAGGSVAALMAALFLLPVANRVGRLLQHVTMDEELLFAGVVMLAFLLMWLASFAEASALGALLAGIGARRLLPDNFLEPIRRYVKVAVYSLLGPALFAWVGATTDMNFLIGAPLLVLALMAVVKSAKIGAAYLSSRADLGDRQAIFAGVALCVKFSTSIVLVKLLYERGFIEQDLYSVLIAAKIGFKFVVPFLLAWMARAWRLPREEYG